MVPTSFPQSNLVLDPPEGVSVEECAPLSCFRGQIAATKTPVIISCWKLTKEEVDELLRTGRLWLWVYGVTMPPVVLHTQSPFTE